VSTPTASEKIYIFSLIRSMLNMTQIQLTGSSMEKVKTTCTICGQKKASWDHHDHCFNCRLCSITEPCHICTDWTPSNWNKIDRQMKEFDRKNLSSVGDDASTGAISPGKRPSSGSESPSSQEGGPSSTKALRVSPPPSWDWDKLCNHLQTCVDVSVTKASSANSKELQAIHARMLVMDNFIQTRRTGSRKGKGDPSKTKSILKLTPSMPTPLDPMALGLNEEELDYSLDESDLNQDLNQDLIIDEDPNHPLFSPDHEEPMLHDTYEKNLVNVITGFGNLHVNHTIDADGTVCIDISDRLRAIATLSKIQPIILSAEQKDTSTFNCVLAKAGEKPSDMVLLPMSPLLDTATNSLIETLSSSSTSNVAILPKLPKPPTVARAPEWTQPKLPTADFASIGHLPSQDELAKVIIPVRYQTILDWEKATRQLMSSLSYSYYASNALCELVRVINAPDQHLDSLQALATAFLICDVMFQCSLLTNAAFLLSSLSLTRRDHFIKGLFARSRQVPKLVRLLRFSPMSQQSLFGDAEAEAIKLLETHLQREANSSLAKSGVKQAPKNARSRSRSRHRDRDAKKKHLQSLSVDVVSGPPAPVQRHVKFDGDTKTPFRGGRRGRPGRGGRGGNQSSA